MIEAHRHAEDAPPQASSRRDFWRLWGAILVLGAVGFSIAFAKLEPPTPRHLRLAAGAAEGAYFAYAEQYAALLAEEGFELEVLETAGSVENLRLLESGEADLALLQGGVTDADQSPTLESLGSLFFEPVWIFYRAAMGQDSSGVGTVTELLGKKIAVGGEGSGTRVLALELLADNLLDAGNSELVALGGSGAARALLAGEVDAAFFVASTRASYISSLLSSDDVDLLSLRRSRAYRVRHSFLSPVVLGEGVVDLDDNLPSRDIEMVAAATSLAARKDLHHALVPLWIEALKDVHGGADFFSELGTFPSKRFLDLPLKSQAEHYLDRGPSFLYRLLPYRTATSVDRLKILLLPFIPLLLVVFKMAPPVYRWRIRSRIYRWYEDLRELDLLLAKEGTDVLQVKHGLATIKRLEQELTEVTVPLSYMDEFFSLRMHMELIQRQLERALRGDK